MARVELTAAAVEDLETLIVTHSLPPDMRSRVRSSLTRLAEFPRLGRELGGRWSPMRFVLGPWRWMLLVCEYDEAEDRVVVLTVQDAGSTRAATSG